MDYYRHAKTDAEAVSLAARCIRIDAGDRLLRHSHQRRIPKLAIEDAEQRLNRSVHRLRQTKSFDELHDLVDSVIRNLDRVGELMVYDVALRIGARFGREPAEVYLHRGTRIGAVALGFDGRRKTIRVGELPQEFRSLRPREVEDLLCIYKDQLKLIGAVGCNAGCWKPVPPG